MGITLTIKNSTGDITRDIFETVSIGIATYSCVAYEQGGYRFSIKEFSSAEHSVTISYVKNLIGFTDIQGSDVVKYPVNIVDYPLGFSKNTTLYEIVNDTFGVEIYDSSGTILRDKYYVGADTRINSMNLSRINNKIRIEYLDDNNDSMRVQLYDTDLSLLNFSGYSTEPNADEIDFLIDNKTYLIHVENELLRLYEVENANFGIEIYNSSGSELLYSYYVPYGYNLFSVGLFRSDITNSKITIKAQNIQGQTILEDNYISGTLPLSLQGYTEQIDSDIILDFDKYYNFNITNEVLKLYEYVDNKINVTVTSVTDTNDYIVSMNNRALVTYAVTTNYDNIDITFTFTNAETETRSYPIFPLTEFWYVKINGVVYETPVGVLTPTKDEVNFEVITKYNQYEYTIKNNRGTTTRKIFNSQPLINIEVKGNTPIFTSAYGKRDDYTFAEPLQQIIGYTDIINGTVVKFVGDIQIKQDITLYEVTKEIELESKLIVKFNNEVIMNQNVLGVKSYLISKGIEDTFISIDVFTEFANETVLSNKEIDYIIVNGGRTDETFSVLNYYADTTIEIFTKNEETTNFDIVLYKMTQNNNVVNKSLNVSKTISCDKFVNSSIVNPTLILDIDNITDYNYLYIGKYNRFYFIDDYKIISNNLYNVQCTSDVLMNFRNSFIGTNQFVNRGSYITNNAIVDSYLPLSNSKKIEITEQSNTFFSKDVMYVVAVNNNENKENKSTQPTIYNNKISSSINKIGTTALQYYIMNETELTKLFQYMSSSALTDFEKLYYNPNEFIESIRVYPISDDRQNILTSFNTDTALQQVRIANVLIDVDGIDLFSNAVKSNFVKRRIFSFYVYGEFLSNLEFLNYNPYTTYTLHLPFYGTLNLPFNIIKERQINVDYQVDITTGMCTIYVSIFNEFENTEYTYTTLSCKIGFELPFTQIKNQNTVGNILNGIGGIGMAAIGVATANPMIVGGGVASLGMNAIETLEKSIVNGSQTMGGDLSSVGGFINSYMIIERTIVDSTQLSQYSRTIGYPYQSNRTLSSSSDFCMIDNLIPINFKGTRTEQEKLKDEFRKGVIL